MEVVPTSMSEDYPFHEIFNPSKDSSQEFQLWKLETGN